jgi:hypothetical protein
VFQSKEKGIVLNLPFTSKGEIFYASIQSFSQVSLTIYSEQDTVVTSSSLQSSEFIHTRLPPGSYSLVLLSYTDQTQFVIDVVRMVQEIKDNDWMQKFR